MTLRPATGQDRYYNMSGGYSHLTDVCVFECDVGKTRDLRHSSGVGEI